MSIISESDTTKLANSRMWTISYIINSDMKQEVFKDYELAVKRWNELDSMKLKPTLHIKL